MNCRSGCGACCVAPSISSPLPGHPGGKPAGARCANLREDFSCSVWGTAAYPPVCRDFTPRPNACGADRDEALALLAALEDATRP